MKQANSTAVETVLGRLRDLGVSKAVMIALIIVAGAALRLGAYLANKSVWQDEAALIMSILRRDAAGLLEPLERAQVAPPGFLLVEKLAVTVLGESEYALRLVPVLLSILSLFLFHALLQRFVRGVAVPIGLALFALAPMLLNWAAEVKQYTSDVFVALALVLLAARMLDHSRCRMRDGVAWGVAGAAGVWLSHPAVFVLAGTGTTVLLSSILGHRRELLRCTLIAAFFWVVGFAALYSLVLADSLGNQGIMMDWWGPYFMPIPPRNAEDLLWLFHAFNWFMGFMVRLTFTGSALEKMLLAVVIAAGLVALYRRFPSGLGMLAAVLFAALGASALRLYPFGERLALYIVPFALLVIAAGLGDAAERLSRRSSVLAAAVATLPIVASAWQAYAIRPWSERSDVKANLRYLHANRVPGQAMYVYVKSKVALEYYSRLWSLPEEDWIRGGADFEEEAELAAEFRSLPSGRVWMLFSDQDDAEAGIRKRLMWAGQVVLVHRAAGSLLFLVETPERS